MPRALRGHTHDPWPCCGEKPDPYGRPKGGICIKCTELIRAGKTAIARSSTDGGKIYKWTSRSHWWPMYYGDYSFSGSSFQDRLAKTMFDLVERLTTSLGKDSHTSWLEGSPDPLLMCDGSHDRYQGAIAVMMHPDVRSKLDALDVAIRCALEDVHRDGIDRGRSALLELAAGELTTDDFNRRVGLEEKKR